MLSTDKIKELVGHAAARLVTSDMTIGIGSGTTVFYFIEAMGKKVRDGFNFQGIPTSTQTREWALKQGIRIVELDEAGSIDLTIDGADETDHQLQLIKGGGGFLLQEKMVAAASNRLVIIADHGKLKDQLGAFPLPVEIVRYGWKQTQQHIEELFGIETKLRLKKGRAYETDHGHYILDCHFTVITDPATVNQSLHLVPGVVETGLFVNMCQQALIGYPDGTVREINKPV
jgi:ribose 5-phosphate isomerase A